MSYRMFARLSFNLPITPTPCSLPLLGSAPTPSTYLPTTSYLTIHANYALKGNFDVLVENDDLEHAVADLSRCLQQWYPIIEADQGT